MKPFFLEDIYNTPVDTPQPVLDKLLLNSRFYFMGGVLWEIDKARRLARVDNYDEQDWARSSYNIFKLIEGIGGRFSLFGLDNLHRVNGPVVFISNHMSTMETMVLPCIIAPIMQVTFIVKESLIKGSFFGPVMRSRDPIAVARKNPKEDLKLVMTKGQELLAKNCSLITFPQNTRKVEFVPEEFNTLGIKLANKAGVQVIPVALKTDFWGNGSLIKDFGPINRNEKIHIAFGTPMDVAGSGKEEHRKTIEFISRHLAKWNNKQ